MRTSTPLLLLLLAGLLLPANGPAAAQAQPLKGLIWQEPQDVRRAESDLLEMSRMGVEAVRTNIVRNEQLLYHADSLGILFFQDLPVRYLPAQSLVDTVGYAARLIELIAARARLHPSARYFGLATMSDTSDPAACPYFEQLTARVKERVPSGKTYYITPYVEGEQCAGNVDFVLLNTLGTAPPLQMLRRWHTAETRSTPVGLASLGIAFLPEARRSGESPVPLEAQARYVENILDSLLQRQPAAVTAAVFVHRWRDLPDSLGQEARVPPPGLNSAQGKRRPLYDVVSGMYSGRQMVFAFNSVQTSGSGWSWRILLGWAAVAALAIAYASSPRLRSTVPRYFGAHAFYRDAIREGRDILLGSSALILLVVSLAAGLAAAALFEQIQAGPVFTLIVQWSLPGVARLLIAMRDNLWIAVLVVGLFYGLSAFIWSIVLALASRRRYSLTFTQAFMLVVWPRWPLLFLLPAALVVPVLAPGSAFDAAAVLVFVWLILTVYGVLRSVYDCYQVSRVPLHVLLIAWLLNPYFLALIAMLVIAVVAEPYIWFLYHLVQYT